MNESLRNAIRLAAFGRNIKQHPRVLGGTMLLLCLASQVAKGNSVEARSFANDTGGVVNDWHVHVRDGSNNLISVVSNGLGPTYTPMPTSTLPGGGAADNLSLIHI